MSANGTTGVFSGHRGLQFVPAQMDRLESSYVDPVPAETVTS